MSDKKVTELKPKKKKDGTAELLKTLKQAAKPPVVEQEEIVDPRSTMTPEEIQEYMKKEEEELFGKVNKFLSSTPKPDTSSLNEEEEEVFTLDFENNVATQKIGEGVVMRDKDGTIHEVKDPDAIKMVKEAMDTTNDGPLVEIDEPVKELPPANELQMHYQNMIVDRFVSKAIANLVEKLNDTAFKTEKLIMEQKLGYGIGEKLAHDSYQMIRKQKFEVQAAIAGGKVHYDKIPEWAKPYVDEYVLNALNTMIDFVQRD